MFLWYYCHPGVIVFVLCLARRYKFLFHIYLLPLTGAVSSLMVPYPFVALVSLDLSSREERQLKIVGWCVVVTTAILMDTGSCHHNCAGGGPGDVLPTHCPPSLRRTRNTISFRTNLKERSPSVTVASLCVPPARARPQVLPYTRKGCVGEVPRCCFG